MEASASHAGSLGELIQGSFNGRDMLLSCPINLYSSIRVFEDKLPLGKYKNAKTAEFLDNVLNRWGLGHFAKCLDIEISSQIPRGKGFASSTADLSALYKALLKLFHKPFNQQELIEECIRIEPTDSIIFEEMTLFEYKTGNFYESIGDYFEFYILVFEGSSIVNTVEFNNKKLPPLAEIEDLLPALRKGIAEKDLRKVGAVSTESITRNQNRLRYSSLNYIKEMNKNAGGFGVIGAHSGDCLGIIFDLKDAAEKARQQIHFLNNYKTYVVKCVNIK